MFTTINDIVKYYIDICGEFLNLIKLENIKKNGVLKTAWKLFCIVANMFYGELGYSTHVVSGWVVNLVCYYQIYKIKKSMGIDTTFTKKLVLAFKVRYLENTTAMPYASLGIKL